jgi:hypothetical protein
MLAHTLFRKGNWVLYKPLNMYCIVATTEPGLSLTDFRGNIVKFISHAEVVGIKLLPDHMPLFNFKLNENKYSRADLPDITITFEGKFILKKQKTIYPPIQFVHELQNVLFLSTGIDENPNLTGM